MNRDEDHEGKGRVEIFDEAENDEMSRFFDQFGFGSMADISFVEIDDNNNQFQPRLYETRGWQDILIEDPLSQGHFKRILTLQNLFIYILIKGQSCLSYQNLKQFSRTYSTPTKHLC